MAFILYYSIPKTRIEKYGNIAEKRNRYDAMMTNRQTRMNN